MTVRGPRQRALPPVPYVCAMPITRFKRLLAAVAILCVGFSVAPLAANAKALKPGDLLTVATMELGPQFTPGVHGYRISYASTNASGAVVPVTGAVLVPAGAADSHKRPVVSWAHGTAGSADICAPSRSEVLYPEPDFVYYAEEVSEFLDAGFIVTAADFPGLGSPGPAEYLIGASEGRSVIDIVRAARKMKVGASKDWFAVGHSQGGQAALFAGELADTYGNGLNLLGVVGIAPASSIELIAQAIIGTPFQGYLALGLAGLQAAYPSYSAFQDLAPPAEARFGVIESGCFTDVAVTFGDLTAEQMIEGGQLSDEALQLLAAQNPANERIEAPVLLQQGTLDDTVPVELTELLTSQRCELGDSIQLLKYEGQTHDGVLGAAIADTLGFLNDRLHHRPFASSCAPTTN